MKAVRQFVAVAVSGVAFASYASCGIAQQVSGELGSPSATTTLSGKQLPPPDPKFGGVIREKGSESKGWWAPRVVPPKGAPNVLLIMTDDAGFGLVGEIATGFPGYDSIIRKGNRTIGEILKEKGYATSWFGRDHNVAFFQNSQANTTWEPQS